MKFLKAVRLSEHDARLLPDEDLLEDGDWAVCGGFAVCDLASSGHRRPGCRCDVSFAGLASPRRCGVAEVVNIDRATYLSHVETLTRQLVENWGAPSEAAARAAAEEEAACTADLCEGFTPGVWITVQRTAGENGVKERYSVFKRLLIGEHEL